MADVVLRFFGTQTDSHLNYQFSKNIIVVLLGLFRYGGKNRDGAVVVSAWSVTFFL